MQSILIIRLSSLGDVILATGLVRQIKGAYPDAAIDVAVDNRFADVWADNPRVRHVYGVDRTSRTNEDLIRQAMQAPYDLVVDLQKNRRSAHLISRMGLPASTSVVTVAKHRLEKLALVWLKRRPSTVTTIAQRYWQTVKHLGVHCDALGPEVWLADDATRVRLQPSRIGIAPGARHATKRWTPEGYAELIRELTARDHQVVLLGGVDDSAVCDQIVRLSGVDVERADGASDLASTVRVLDRCRVVVSNDSALMHLARARRIPVVAIFGSTVPELGFAPEGNDVRVIQNPNVACRPCSHIGRDACPKGHFRCMTQIEPTSVVAAVWELLGQ